MLNLWVKIFAYQRNCEDTFHEYASKQPIVDYHCHIDPKQIYEDKTFEDIAEIWLGETIINGAR